MDETPIEDVLDEILENNPYDPVLEDELNGGQDDDLLGDGATFDEGPPAKLKSQVAKPAYSNSGSNLITLTSGSDDHHSEAGDGDDDDEDTSSVKRGQRGNKFASERASIAVVRPKSVKDIPDSLDKVVVTERIVDTGRRGPNKRPANNGQLGRPMTQPGFAGRRPPLHAIRHNTQPPGGLRPQIHINPRFRNQFQQQQPTPPRFPGEPHPPHFGVGPRGPPPLMGGPHNGGGMMPPPHVPFSQQGPHMGPPHFVSRPRQHSPMVGPGPRYPDSHQPQQFGQPHMNNNFNSPHNAQMPPSPPNNYPHYHQDHYPDNYSNGNDNYIEHPQQQFQPYNAPPLPQNRHPTPNNHQPPPFVNHPRHPHPPQQQQPHFSQSYHNTNFNQANHNDEMGPPHSNSNVFHQVRPMLPPQQFHNGEQWQQQPAQQPHTGPPRGPPGPHNGMAPPGQQRAPMRGPRPQAFEDNKPPYNEVPLPSQPGRVRHRPPLLPSFPSGPREPHPPFQNAPGQRFSPPGAGGGGSSFQPRPPQPIRNGGGLLPTPGGPPAAPTTSSNAPRPLNPTATPFYPQQQSQGSSPLKRKAEFASFKASPAKNLRVITPSGGNNGNTSPVKRIAVAPQRQPINSTVRTVSNVKPISTVSTNRNQQPQSKPIVYPIKRDDLQRRQQQKAGGPKIVAGIQVDDEYSKKLEEQKRMREEILKKKEERRKEMVQKKSTFVH